jgi:hypothetical protein
MDSLLGWRKFLVVILVVVGGFWAGNKGWMGDAVAAQLIGFALITYFGANVSSKFAGKDGTAEGSVSGGSGG